MRKMSKTRQNARVQTFAYVAIALLIVVCGKSLYNKHFYNVNKHVGYDMTSTMT